MKTSTQRFVVLTLLGASGALLAQGGGGADAIDKLGAAKELMEVIDSGLFHWIGRLMAGICILSAGWALKEQKFSVAVVCLLGAMLFGTAVKWVKNVFSMGGDASGVFDGSMVDPATNESYELAKSLIESLKNA